MKSFNGRSIWMFAAFALAFCLVFSLVMFPMMGKAADAVSGLTQTGIQQRTINVTGTADVMIAPDEVDITVGVETRNAEFKKAKSVNNSGIKKVIDLTKKYGIEPKYVQTDYIRTYPSYVYEQYTETNKISFYNVQKRVVIKLKDISKFEALISDLMENENTLIQNVDFHSTELTKYKSEARKLAVRAAKDKAKLLTAELDSNIGRPLTISEEQIDNFTWFGSWWSGPWYGYGQSNAALSNVMANYQSTQTGPASGQTGDTVSIGQIKITAKIGVVFELK